MDERTGIRRTRRRTTPISSIRRPGSTTSAHGLHSQNTMKTTNRESPLTGWLIGAFAGISGAFAMSLVQRRVFKKRAPARQKAAPLMHYAMGAISGAAYGRSAERTGLPAFGAGLPFGAAVWIAADEVAMPLLGLSKLPSR